MEIENPVIWRKVAVPVDLNFHDLNLIIQAAMGWENQHLYTFQESLESKYFTLVSPYAEEFGADAKKTPSTNILWSYLNQFHMDEDAIRDKMYYQYDYGDDWMHEIEVVDYDRSDRVSPELLDGEGACPPENCGGIPGFQMLKECLIGRMTKEEYYGFYCAIDVKGYDIHKIDIPYLRARVKGWRRLER